MGGQFSLKGGAMFDRVSQPGNNKAGGQYQFLRFFFKAIFIDLASDISLE